MRSYLLAALVLAATPLHAQRVELPRSLEKFAATATEKVEMDLDASMLSFASKLLSDSNPEEAAAKALITRLKGIYVRTYTFANDGEFLAADLGTIREQLQTPEWTRFITTLGSAKKFAKPHVPAAPPRGEQIEVWMFRESEATRKQRGSPGSEALSGLLVLSTTSRQITLVNIVGPIRPEDFAALGGRFGIPKLDLQRRDDHQ